MPNKIGSFVQSMVLSVYDIDDYRSYFDVHPIRKVANETVGYDCLLMGTRFGIGFIKNGQIVERPQFELDVKGRIRCMEMYTISDEREKSNIEPITLDECASIVGKINVFRYGFNTQPDTKRYGFIAQDLELADDCIVNSHEPGVKSIDTTQILALAIGSIKQLQERVCELERSHETLYRFAACPDHTDSIAAPDADFGACQSYDANLPRE